MIRALIPSLLFIISGLGSSTARSEWAGLSVYLGETTSDLQFETAQRSMRQNSLGLRIEDKAASGLRAGISIGQTSIRTSNKLPPDSAQKFEGNNLGFYLRYPLHLGEHLSLEGSFSYHYNSASDSNISSPSEIEWRDSRVQISLGGKFQALRIAPFIAYHSMSGDISNDTRTELFANVDEISRGVSFDFFIEPTAYIRLHFSRGNEDGGYLTFARVY